jgi:hypothetical protein
VSGARGEIRTHHKADLKSAASSNWATRANNLNWYSRRDSNPHCTDLESAVSCRLDYASKALPIFDCQLPIHSLDQGVSPENTSIGNRQLKIGNVEWYRRRDSNPHCLVPKTSASSQLGYAGMVNPAGLEPATCRLGNDCSHPSELRVRRLVAETGLEPASTDYEPVPGGFTTPVYSASYFSNWLRRKDSNLRMTRSRDERRSTWLLRKGISDFRFARGITFLTPRTNRKSAIKDRKCFWWTWHDLNVRPRPSQSRALIPLSYRSELVRASSARSQRPVFPGTEPTRCKVYDSDSGNGGDGAIRTLTGFLPAP